MVKNTENAKEKTSSKDLVISQLKEQLKTQLDSFEEQLQQEIQKRGLIEKQCQKHEEKAQYYSDEYDRLILAFRQSQRAQFGKKSERFIDDENPQLALFDSSADKNDTTDPKNVETITYKRSRKGKGSSGSTDIPTREVIMAKF